jgi:hypothetical protein
MCTQLRYLCSKTPLRSLLHQRFPSRRTWRARSAQVTRSTAYHALRRRSTALPLAARFRILGSPVSEYHSLLLPSPPLAYVKPVDWPADAIACDVCGCLRDNSAVCVSYPWLRFECARETRLRGLLARPPRTKPHRFCTSAGHGRCGYGRRRHICRLPTAVARARVAAFADVHLVTRGTLAARRTSEHLIWCLLVCIVWSLADYIRTCRAST